MKITDSEVIKNGEMELIDSITGDLDWRAIETILKEKHNLGLQDEVEYKHGDLVIHDNQIAYKLDFDVKVTLSVLFDRQGNCLKLSTSGDQDVGDQETGKPVTPEAAHQPEMHQTVAAPSEQFQDTEPLDNSQAEDRSEILSDAEPNENISQMASQIADMITEINKE